MPKYDLILTSEELSSPISLSVLDLIGPRGSAGYTSVVEYSNLASFPATGEAAVLYLAVDTVNYYRWNGASYDLVLDTSKLAGIEAGATADQTGAEIKALYEAELDTNAYTDSEKSKLAGIEAGADVTDTANVTAAGAVMDSELTSEASVKALDQGVATTDSPAFVNTTLTGYLGGPATFTIDPAAIGDNTGKVIIAGDLQVDGTTTTVNSTTVDVGDKNITLGSNATADTENHEAGVSVYRPDSVNSSLKWNETLDQWESSHTLDITGDLTLTGTVDGRDLAIDGSKLDGIEAGATADQTGAEIKLAYEAEANTNAFTDSEKSKLAGIESGATGDMTGAEIKALYETEANAFTDAQFTKLAGIETGATADQTGAEIKSLYEAEANTNAYTDAEKTKLAGVESGATADQTGAEIKALYETEANAFTDAQFTKLAGIETGATADQTGAEIKTALFAEADTNNLTDTLLTKLNGAVQPNDSPTFGTLNATTVDFGDWTVTESGGSLYFATGGINKMKLDASGNLQVVGSVESNATNLS